MPSTDIIHIEPEYCPKPFAAEDAYWLCNPSGHTIQGTREQFESAVRRAFWHAAETAGLPYNPDGRVYTIFLPYGLNLCTGRRAYLPCVVDGMSRVCLPVQGYHKA